jgi:hypothetical protein
MTTPARQFQTQQIHFLRKGFTFADQGTTLTVGELPAGSVVLKPLSGINISTTFNGSPQSATLGISGTTNFWATGMSLSAVTFVAAAQTASFFVATDTLVVGTVTATTVTQGVGQFIVAYIPNIDG